MAHEWKIVEKKNPLAVHALCHSRESAQQWIAVNAPLYCARGSRESAQQWIAVNAPLYCVRGYFVDKTLTPDSFKIEEPSK